MTDSSARSTDVPPRGRRRRTALALAAASTVTVLATICTGGTAVADGLSPGDPNNPNPAGDRNLSAGDSGPITDFSGLCLDDAGASTANGNPVEVYPCNSSAAQNWKVVEAGSTIRDFGKCLDIRGGGTANGTTVDLYACNSTGAQVFIPESNGTLYNPQSNKCLDVPNWATSAIHLDIWTCTGSGNQVWRH